MELSHQQHAHSYFLISSFCSAGWQIPRRTSYLFFTSVFIIQIIIFPTPLYPGGFQYRTPRLNKVVQLIYSLNAAFLEIKNRKEDDNLLLSGLVASTPISIGVSGTSETVYLLDVASTGIEPVSGASETLILSIVLRGQNKFENEPI